MTNHNHTPDSMEEEVRWMDDLLAGRSGALPAHLQGEEGARRRAEAELEMLERVRREVPAKVELPYGDFFMARLERRLEKEGVEVASREKAPPRAGWWVAWPSWALSLGAVSAVLVAFFLGTQVPRGAGGLADSEGAVERVYAPVQGVSANVVSPDAQQGELIVVNGLSPLPDDLGLDSAEEAPREPVETRMPVRARL